MKKQNDIYINVSKDEAGETLSSSYYYYYDKENFPLNDGLTGRATERIKNCWEVKSHPITCKVIYQERYWAADDRS